MQTDKILSMMGLARRAGRLYGGYDLACEKIREGQARLALAASDISEKTFKNLRYEAEKRKIPAERIEADMETMGKACGIKAGVAVITDEGMAETVRQLMCQPSEGGERV